MTDDDKEPLFDWPIEQVTQSLYHHLCIYFACGQDGFESNCYAYYEEADAAVDPNWCCEHAAYRRNEEGFAARIRMEREVKELVREECAATSDLQHPVDWYIT